MKPLKSDFASFVPFTPNISDDLVNPRIDDAFKFDIRPRLGSLADDIKAYSSNDRPNLKALYDDYILHWWVLLAYKRFIELHGKNITQFGMTKTKDPGGTFDPISVEERSVMLKQVQSDVNTLFNMVLERLGDLNWTLDNIKYRRYTDGTCRPAPGNDFGINAIG